MFRLIGRSALLLGVGALLLMSSPQGDHGPDKVQISGAQGLTASLTATGSYRVSTLSPAWEFGGELGVPASNLKESSGHDGVGFFKEIDFEYHVDTERRGSIRAYSDQMIVLFSVSYAGAAQNIAPFPTLSSYPSTSAHLTFSGSFSAPSFVSYSNSGPWVLFDGSANTAILSPAANFMTAQTSWNSQSAIESGIVSSITTLPAGFTHSTLLVIEPGINPAFETWGHALTNLTGKVRLANDADLSLAQLGYWTDNGSSYYYYKNEHGMSTVQTLQAVKSDFDTQGISLGYMQLDSWFYPKGPQADWRDNAEGIYEYAADAALFPAGLSSFQKTLGLPLIAHARWIDPSSPYHREYEMSGNVVTDPLYWADRAKYLQEAGVVSYEQDWLGKNAQTELNLTDPDAFLTNMSAAMEHAGLTMQYCMGTPGHFLESTRFPNVTSVRTANDRLNPPRWINLLYTARLASALGLWPFADVFLSAEIDNLLVATLTAGPVGIGDAVGTIVKGNLLQAVRPDGVIVKPDVSLTPIDKSFLNSSVNPSAPVVASTYTDFDGYRVMYVFAFNRGTGTAPSLSYADLGVNGPAYAFDYFAGTGKLVDAGDPFPAPPVNAISYTIIAPVGLSGIAVLGDRAHFVSMGKKRILQFRDNGQVQISVSFAQGEHVRTIQGYAPAMPKVTRLHGVLGTISYDAVTRLFMINVGPATDLAATIQIGL